MQYEVKCENTEHSSVFDENKERDEHLIIFILN